MRPNWHRFLPTVLPVGLLVLLHEGLLRWIVDENLIAVLLSGGNQAPRGTLAFALFFVGLRLVVIVVVPAWVTWRLMVLFLTGAAPPWRTPATPPAPPPPPA